MKIFYAFMTWLMLIIALVFCFWSVEEATKPMSNSWVWLVEVWAGVFVLITIALFVFKKKILGLSTAKGMMAIFATLIGGCALGDTLYVIDLYQESSQYYTPTNQLIICLALWLIATVNGVLAARKN